MTCYCLHCEENCNVRVDIFEVLGSSNSVKRLVYQPGSPLPTPVEAFSTSSNFISTFFLSLREDNSIKPRRLASLLMCKQRRLRVKFASLNDDQNTVN